MFTSMNKQQKHSCFKYFFALLPIFLLFFFMVPPTGAIHLSDHHSINFDSHSAKNVDKELMNKVKQFFTEAEMAMQTKNIEALMRLYSDNYLNDIHKKDDVRKIWERIFSSFDVVVSMHNMRFLGSSTDNHVVIIRCSGILMGIPKGENELRPIDNWVNSDHVLAKENGKWRLIGSVGKERNRLWFDKALHPLF